jgi:hypothetical protein
MNAIEANVGGRKLRPGWTQTDVDEGLTARLLRSIWHAFRDGAAMYALSHWAAPDSAIAQAEPQGHSGA